MSPADPSGIAALIKDYRNYAGARLWLSLALMLLGALAEGFGLLMIVPLASIAIGASGATTERFAPWLANVPADQRLFLALAMFLAAMAVRSALLFARDVQTTAQMEGYEASLKLRCAATLSARGWSFAARIGQAGMQSMLLSDVPRASSGISAFQQIGIYGAMLLVQLALTAVLAPVLTAIALGFIVAGALVSKGWLQRSTRRGFSIVHTMAESADSGFRLHSGLKSAIAQGTVGAFLREYRSSLAAAQAHLVGNVRDVSGTRQVSALAAAFAAALLLFVGVRMLDLPFPVLIAALALFARMAGPAQAVQQSVQQLASCAPAFAGLEQRLGALTEPEATAGHAAPLKWHVLALAQVTFDHKKGLGIGDASLVVERGSWVGIAGPSGSGKTTLVDLVAGLLAPQAGSVTVDGKPLSGETLRRWREGLAYAAQEPSVFNDSVRGNLLAEGAAAGDEALWAALETVGLAGRVRAFAAGLDESVGDRGSQLSGGERQRLVLARALLRRPTLLILDEATAALDPEAEAGLLSRLKALEPRPAALIVAHRESTLAYCDRVVAIQHGRLEKRGG
ncbi:MAG: ABC transporter ATP-binding protein [Pseudomonadota bacterium]